LQIWQKVDRAFQTAHPRQEPEELTSSSMMRSLWAGVRKGGSGKCKENEETLEGIEMVPGHLNAVHYF
jgi:hypothetical protein